MKSLLLSAVAIFLSTMPATLAAASPNAATYTLSQFGVGRTITGPAVDLSKAKGKAVFIDAWGVHCGPCIALLPEVERISRTHKDKLVVVGAHCQGGPDDAVKAIVKAKQLSYGITEGVRSPIQFGGLPFGFVFDAQGTLLFAGRPGTSQFNNALKKAVDTASGTSGLDALKALQQK